MKLLVVLGVASLFATLLWYLLLHRPVLPPTASQRALRPDGVTQNDFRALHYGRKSDNIPRTTCAQAAALMGEGTLLDTSADGRTRTYQWSGGGRWGPPFATASW